MPMLMIRCPATGAPVPTGIELDEASFKSSELQGSTVSCVLCGKAHRWEKKDAFFVK